MLQKHYYIFNVVLLFTQNLSCATTIFTTIHIRWSFYKCILKMEMLQNIVTFLATNCMLLFWFAARLNWELQNYLAFIVFSESEELFDTEGVWFFTLHITSAVSPQTLQLSIYNGVFTIVSLKLNMLQKHFHILM